VRPLKREGLKRKQNETTLRALNHSTIETELAKFALDAYKERTGDYHAAKIPKYTDFIEVKAPAQVRFPATIKKYGLSRFDYWRLLAKQNNRCAICGELQNGRALHLDHCHTSNKVRALICHGCNIAIGMIKEDAQTARAIADYLDRHATLVA
jgi:hypothetical protein